MYIVRGFLRLFYLIFMVIMKYVLLLFLLEMKKLGFLRLSDRVKFFESDEVGT